MRCSIAYIALVGLSIQAYGQSTKVPQIAPQAIPPSAIEKGRKELKTAQVTGSYQLSGIASFYAEKFHNRTTANGEKFDMNQLTAAHRTLPFNTIVKVVNQKNKREAIVRINDRGPYLRGRVIDLSKRAAETIGMIATGTAPVKITILKMGTTQQKNIPLSSNKKNPLALTETQRADIQVASYQYVSNAERLVMRLSEYKIRATIHENNGYFRVIISNLNKNTLYRIMITLKNIGFINVIIKKR